MQWIPTAERLPECREGEHVKVFMTIVETFADGEQCRSVKDGFYAVRLGLGEFNDFAGWPVDEVIAWQYLPEPYNPEATK